MNSEGIPALGEPKMLLGREVVVEPFVKDSDWTYAFLEYRNMTKKSCQDRIPSQKAARGSESPGGTLCLQTKLFYVTAALAANVAGYLTSSRPKYGW